MAISAIALPVLAAATMLFTSGVPSPPSLPSHSKSNVVKSADAAIDETRLISEIFSRFPNTTVTYYDVDGLTARSIRASLDAARPIDPHDHRPADGHSDWRMDWRWRGDGRDGCDLANATVAFRGQVTLPRHVSEARLDPALLKDWRRYLLALANHEAGHIRHAYDHIGDVRAAIGSSHCDGANAAATTASQALARFDVDYDAITHHGASQGAVFD